MKAVYWLRTGLLFVLMTGILVVIGSVVGSFFGSWKLGFLAMFAVSIVFNLISLFGSKRMALSANKVTLVTYDQEPRLYSTVQRLADRMNLPMPEVGVSPLPMPNAFATGRGPKNAAVVATRQLLDLLNDDELEGVMAHEMSHVKNRDILVMSVASMMASLIAFATRMAVYSALFSDDRNGSAFLIAILADITLPIAAMLIQLGVSRSREYLADESGARVTGKPLALVSALRKLETGCSSSRNTYDNPSTADMWISDPYGKKKKRSLISLFSTHPATEDRIARLEKLDKEINGGFSQF